MSKAKEIFVRLDRCVGCHSCELACAVAHSAAGSLYTALAETPVPRKRVYVETVQGKNIPMLCRHCEEPACEKACLTGALTQDAVTRIVSHDPDKCIGCWMCTMVCPYGMVGRMMERRVAVKCDRCPDRDEPACVEACTTRALVFSEGEQYAAAVRTGAAARMAESYDAGRSSS